MMSAFTSPTIDTNISLTNKSNYVMASTMQAPINLLNSIPLMNPITTINKLDADEISVTTDLIIGDVSLKNFMKTVSDRLLILTPDPAKLEKYEALRKSYEHFKLLEALLDSE